MTPQDFPERNVIYAENQKEYLPLPAHVSPEGVVTTCWQLTEDELEQVLVTGKIFLQVHTFREPLQPIGLSAVKPVLQ